MAKKRPISSLTKRPRRRNLPRDPLTILMDRVTDGIANAAEQFFTNLLNPALQQIHEPNSPPTPIRPKKMEDIFDDEFWAKRGWPLPPKPRRITAYDVLEVSPQASQETITAAYKSLSKRFHPDVCKGGEEKMKGITAAYQIVGDPKKRKEYDRQIKENRQ